MTCQPPPPTLGSTLRHAFAHASAMTIRYVRVLCVFWFLTLLLWSALLRPSIEVDIQWVPKSFLSTSKMITCIVRMHHTQLAPLEAMFFAGVAVLGYFLGITGVGAAERTIYGCTLSTFEQHMMGIKQKYYWLCYVPWIVTFIRNWVHSVAEFLLLYTGHDVYEAYNVYTAMLFLMVYFLMQLLLTSEVLFMMLQGFCVLKNINNENVEWERKKQMFDDRTMETVFGEVN